MMIRFVLACSLLNWSHAIEVPVDFSKKGPEFLGFGALSGGTGARLLYDYPEPQRSQILDVLFLPNAGAALQVLKVEIGGDTQSTEGTEPSHMFTREDGRLSDSRAYNRGWEWWLLEEAKKRNPNIVTIGLSWGVPGWIANGTNGSQTAYWSDDNIDYHVRWVQGLKKYHGIQLDYMGIWNEKAIPTLGFDFVVHLRKALDAEPYGVGKHVGLLAADTVKWMGSSKNMTVCDDLLENQELRESVVGVSNHYDAEDHTPPASCEKLRSQYGKSLWVSEGHGGGDALSQAYITSKVTGYVQWPMIPGWYPMLPYNHPLDHGCGYLLCAQEPWSGFYNWSNTLVTTAHTTQFSAPRGACTFAHIGAGVDGNLTAGIIGIALDCGKLGWTVVITYCGKHCKGPPESPPQLLDMKLSAPPNTGEAEPSLWSTCGSSPSQWMQKQKVNGTIGNIRLAVNSNCVYTLSTVKGGGLPKVANPHSSTLGLPFQDSFDHRQDGEPAKYFEDISGTFMIQKGMLTQMVSERPIEWEKNSEPYTIVGDQRWGTGAHPIPVSSWEDYSVEVSAAVTSKSEPGEGAAFVRVCGRINDYQRRGYPPLGYCLVVEEHQWYLSAGGKPGSYNPRQGSPQEVPNVIAKGNAQQGASIGKWLRLGISFKGNTISCTINGTKVVSHNDNTYKSGLAAIGSGWHTAQFDDFSVQASSQVGESLYV